MLKRLIFQSVIWTLACWNTCWNTGRLAVLGWCVLMLPATLAMAMQVPPELERNAGANLNVGDPVGTFRVIKVAGGDDDGVEIGATLCYRCRYGSSPMALVFVRRSSTQIDDLIQSLDHAIQTHPNEKLRGLVVLLGDDTAKLKEQAEQLADRTGVERVPVVVSVDGNAGPPAYRLSTADEVSVVVAKDSQVVATQFSAADRVRADTILKHIEAMLTP